MLPKRCIIYEELVYVYKMSIMLVMPTLFESVSIPIYESFFLKVPVCASNVVDLTEQVGGSGILFDPNDSYDISKKISILLNNENIRNEKNSNLKRFIILIIKNIKIN